MDLQRSALKKKIVRSRVDKDVLKNAQKALRDTIVWCCVSICGGLDSKPAFVRALEEVIEQMDHFPGMENLVSQCTNAYRRVREDVACAQLPKRACTSGGSGCGPRDQGSGGSQVGAVMGAVMGSSGVGACSHEQGMRDEGGGGDGGAVGGCQLEVAPASSGEDVNCSGLGATAGDGRSLSPARRRSRSPRRRHGGESSQMAEMVEMLRGIKRDVEGLKPGYHQQNSPCMGYHQQNSPYMPGCHQQNNRYFQGVTCRHFYRPEGHQYVGSDCDDDNDDSDSDDSDGYDQSCNRRADCGHEGRPA